MKRLSETAPYVYQEFCDGNHPVKRSKNKFNQVWTDQALEQTTTKDGKTKGGSIGLINNQLPYKDGVLQHIKGQQ